MTFFKPAHPAEQKVALPCMMTLELRPCQSLRGQIPTHCGYLLLGIRFHLLVAFPAMLGTSNLGQVLLRGQAASIMAGIAGTVGIRIRK